MSEETFREIASTLKELLKWSRFSGMQQLRNVLSQNLKNDSEMLIYELSDGSRGARDVAGAVGVSHQTVLNYLKKWNKVGIVEPSPNFQGRYQRICSLEEVGLEVPLMPRPAEEKLPKTEVSEVKENE